MLLQYFTPVNVQTLTPPFLKQISLVESALRFAMGCRYLRGRNGDTCIRRFRLRQSGHLHCQLRPHDSWTVSHLPSLNVRFNRTPTSLTHLGRPVFAAANYIILSRTLYYIPYYTPMHPGRVLTTFIGLDVLIETLTVNGAAMAFNSDNKPGTRNSGGNMIKAGLFLQLGTIFLFVATAITFYVRCTKANVLHRRVRQVLYTLFISCALIVIRSIHGIVVAFEALSSDRLGPSIENEWIFWVFDATVMLINSYLLNVMHPGRLLPRNHKIYLARDGVTELVGPGWLDKRPFIVTVVDPFDIMGLLTGRDRKTAFWEQQGTDMSAAGNGRRSVC